jgi:two-component system response regulator PhoP/two-component system response regulator TctD
VGSSTVEATAAPPSLDPSRSGQVAYVHWPEDEAGAQLARLQGSPRLLLVAPGAPPPPCVDLDEDWVRLPALDEDIRARAATLARRTMRPSVIGDGRIVFRGEWAPLSNIEEALARVLAENFGSVVGSDVLAATCDDRHLTANAIRVHLARLRKRIRSLGLVVGTVRGKGYVLEAADP